MEVQLHPFFFIVILVSIQYGTNRGLIAAALSTVILLVGNIQQQSLSQDLFEFLFYISYRPMLWVALAILLGGIRDKYYLNLEFTQNKFALMEKQAVKFSKAYKLLDRERIRLEVNLTSQPCSVHFLSQIAEKTKALDHREIFNNLLDFTETLIRPEKCSWYLLENNNLKMVSQSGWEEEDEYINSFSPSSDLYREIVENKRFLCVTNPEDSPLITDHGVLAGPLYNKDSGKLYGMIKIEEMGFLGLNLTNIETFKVLCQWLGTLLDTSMRFQQSQNSVLQSSNDFLLPLKYYRYFSDFLVQFSNGGSFESHTIYVNLSEKASINFELQTRIKQALFEISQEEIENTVFIFENTPKNLGFIILLPNASLVEAKIFSNKLESILALELGNQEQGKLFFLAIKPTNNFELNQQG